MTRLELIEIIKTVIGGLVFFGLMYGWAVVMFAM